MTVLLAVLAVMVLVLGCLGWWWLTKMGAEYQHGIADTAITMNRAQDIGTHASMGYGSLQELRQTKDPEKRADLLRNMAHERAIIDKLYEELDRTLTDSELRSHLAHLIEKRLATRKLSGQLMAEMEAGTAAKPDSGTSQQLLQAFIEYQKAGDVLVQGIQDASLRACDNTVRKIEGLRWFFLVVGVLPLAAALLFLSAILTLLRLWPLHEDDE
jgi:hypothetical protein